MFVCSIIISGNFIFKVIFVASGKITLNFERESVTEVYVDYHSNDSNNFPTEGKDEFTLSPPE